MNRTDFDRILHFLIGLVLGSLGYFIFSLRACLLGIAVGILKEFYDVCKRTEPPFFDSYDLLATVVGCFFGTALLWSQFGGAWL